MWCQRLRAEDWTDIMYFCQYGCDGWGDYPGATGGSDYSHEPFGLISVIYFSLFVLTSARETSSSVPIVSENP